MVVPPILPDSLDAPSPSLHMWQSCARMAVHRCHRACVRATLLPCVRVCKRLIVDPAVKGFGVYSFAAYLHKFVRQLHAACKNKPDFEREAFIIFTNKCLLGSAREWAKEWIKFLYNTLNRICIRICARVCKLKCRRSCRTPCSRIAMSNVSTHFDALKRVDNSLYHCLLKCTQTCREACVILAEKWVYYKIRNISRHSLATAVEKLPDQWRADEIIKERKKLTNKCNVLNGCRF